MEVNKATKYDRQLRLWASTGQYNLENSHICLINATATGSEVLKNLVLPGIGKFTIIDDNTVDQSCLQGNFFLNRSNLNQSKAEAITKKLMDLNNDVKGIALKKPIQNLINDSAFWDQFNVVIVSDYVANLSTLTNLLWDKQIPLLVVNTLGYYGSVNLIANEITVIETHDPQKTYELRIDKPWPELQTYVDSFNLDEMDEIEHAHVPYLIIYIKALHLWKLDHNGNPPTTYVDKQSFKTYIENMSNNKYTEENFIEALQTIHRALQLTQIPSSIQKLFQSSNIKNVDQSTSLFWIYVKALKNFADIHGALPLSGNLPDMVSDTTSYIRLQNLYRNKAIQDQGAFAKEVMKLLNSTGRSQDEITQESMKAFCKNSQLLYVSDGSKDITTPSLVTTLFDESDDNDDENFSILAIYYAILTFNRFIDLKKYRPSIEDYDEFVKVFVKSFGIKQQLTPAIMSTFKEVLTHNTSDYHNLNSLMGGVVSQEVLKLATSQYTPLDNLFVFDGIRSMSSKWKI